MRPLALSLLALAVLSAISAETPYPFWDGSETIAEYAKRANLPATKTLELGNGVKLELVLIPAGKFLMGTPEPPPVDAEYFIRQIWIGVIAVWIGGSVLTVLLVLVIGRAIRQRRRPQWSLAWLLGMVLGTAVGLLGGMHWYYSELTLADAQNKYFSALARFQSSYDWEKPAHEVTLTQAFYIGKYEVTQEQYQQVMGMNPSNYIRGPDLPVEGVSWKEAQEFCKRVVEGTEETLRLPSEAEWEYACRAGTQTTYYSGDDVASLDRAGWYVVNSKAWTRPVGQKEANAFGLYDMCGNVWEWCEDDWHKGYAGAPANGAAWSDEPRGAARVLRGGSCIDLPRYCRSACRHSDHPDLHYDRSGFRVVVAAPRTP